jgi:hypothetical protein
MVERCQLEETISPGRVCSESFSEETFNLDSSLGRQAGSAIGQLFAK